jgi:hypothetical protein
LAPVYVDVAVRRWQAFSGNKAIKEADGRAFDDLVNDSSPGPAS